MRRESREQRVKAQFWTSESRPGIAGPGRELNQHASLCRSACSRPDILDLLLEFDQDLKSNLGLAVLGLCRFVLGPAGEAPGSQPRW